MKRAALCLFLTGTAFAGGGGAPPPPTDDALRPLRGLSGRAFDLAWLDEMTGRQTVLGGLSELERRYGQQPELKAWAARDLPLRQAAVLRLQTLRAQVEPPQSVSSTDVIVAIANGSEADFLNRFDSFFLAEYAKASAQVSALARLALSRSQHPALRREASALLRNEERRRSGLKEFR
ncbi:hypothetical protein SAMN04488058_107128 [Deinococcus reticulitermitis]|uniref:DUF4142 domain-containing protein n=1 Tax=Deinococcus reticulitermitis TaxID=856736 RepID=A0A1H6YUN1_9DEIO|nr:DUF4142 domain-containing protein [Deinococcus reticulitermitis]SEJ41002.1 hypothetical protein SAMN04488058_107128 [Deinococcus reticulitermitis]